MILAEAAAVVCQSDNRPLDKHVVDLVTEDMAHNPLKSFRENHEPPMSQAGLAKLLGKSRPTVHRWENGERKIGLESLSTVSEKTGISKRELRPDLAEKLDEVVQ